MIRKSAVLFAVLALFVFVLKPTVGNAGDFAVGPGPQEHEPIADPGEPCIALIVLSSLGRPLARLGVVSSVVARPASR